jgi:replicative DNA helicase
MEQNYYNDETTLTYKNISNSADEIVYYIDGRRTTRIRSLKTKWDKFNRLCMGGIEPNVIYTVCGISGSGKSSFVNSLEVDIYEENKNIDFVILNFSFEMTSSRQVGRKLSYKLGKTTSELYSGSGEYLNEEDFKEVKKYSEEIKKHPIYYVDIPGNVQQIRNTIIHFMKNEGKNKWVIIILDHTLLTKGKTGESERETLAKLQYMFMELKKYGKNTIIQLSQLNRDIESVDRIANHSMHYPMRKDLFGGDSIFQTSDYVLVIHRPETLGIESYGLHHLPTEDMVYLHFLKNREGKLGILTFKNDLKYNKLIEVNIEKEKETNEKEITINF